MYFANNPADKNFCASVIQAFLKASEAEPGLRMHALLDAAFDEDGFAAFTKSFKGSVVPVYADSVYSGGVEIGPHLLEVNISAASAARDEINALLTFCGSRPMFSLWVTEMEAYMLAAQWRPFVSAQLEDGSTYMLRFADVRILHSLTSTLTPAQHAHFLPGTAQIWMPARNGQFIAIKGQAQDNQAPITQLVLDKAQFNTLMQNAEPDAIIVRMTEDGTAAYATASGADLYAFVSAQIKRANQYHITQTPDLVTYCELAWNMGPEFDQDEHVNAALMKVTPSNRLSKVLPEVPAKAWERLEAMHQKSRLANA